MVIYFIIFFLPIIFIITIYIVFTVLYLFHTFFEHNCLVEDQYIFLFLLWRPPL